MSLLTKDKITQIFCLAADLCKEYSAEINSHKKLPADEGKKHATVNMKCPTVRLSPF